MATRNLEITNGSTFELLALINDVNGTPLNMTGYTGGTAGARSKIRKKASDVAASATFTVSILNKTGVLAAIAAGQCHITTAEIAALKADSVGKCYVLLRLTATDTAALAKGCYQIWDLEIEDTSGFVFKPFTGSVTVLPEATK